MVSLFFVTVFERSEQNIRWSWPFCKAKRHIYKYEWMANGWHDTWKCDHKIISTFLCPIYLSTKEDWNFEKTLICEIHLKPMEMICYYSVKNSGVRNSPLIASLSSCSLSDFWIVITSSDFLGKHGIISEMNTLSLKMNFVEKWMLVSFCFCFNIWKSTEFGFQMSTILCGTNIF